MVRVKMYREDLKGGEFKSKLPFYMIFLSKLEIYSSQKCLWRKNKPQYCISLKEIVHAMG